MSNRSIAARLLDTVREGRAPHAILITGPEGSAAGALARRAAAVYCCGRDDVALLVSCPDYFELGPAPIPVDAIRQLQLSLVESAFSGRRAAVLLDAHRMNAHAQNALLKTLEEPPENTLLLLSGLEAGMLLTIRSRCSTLRLGAEPEEEIRSALVEAGVPREMAALAARLSEGAPELAHAFADEAHAAYYEKAAALLFAALYESVPPYTRLAALLDEPLVKDKDAKSKAARQRPGAEFLLRVWLLLLRDILLAQYGAPLPPSAPQEAAQTAKRFTTGEIQGIIDRVLSARIRLGVANPSLTMDALITDIKG